MTQGVVFHQTVACGLANPDGKLPIAYFGKVFRIPRTEHDTIRQLEWELDPRELLRDVTDAHGQPLHPAQQAIIERLEMYDQDSGDVWVMYRVPYRQGQTASHDNSSARDE